MRRMVVMAALVGGLAMGGCKSSPKREVALPPGPAVVSVNMDDASFKYDQAVPAGRVVFRVQNVGTLLHNMVVLPLTDDLPPINEQLRGQERRVVQPFAAVRPVLPGDTREFAVDLEPGRRYGIICSVSDAEGKSHALKGQNSEFRADGSPPGQPSAPGSPPNG